MRFIDEKFKKYPEKYIYQSMMATLFIFIVMYFIDIIDHSAIVASMGASSFIVFTLPKQDIARPRLVLGGYFVGILVGILCCYFGVQIVGGQELLQKHNILRALLASVSVGLAIFIMVVTNTEHPPAAGIALGLVFNPWNIKTLLFIIIAALVLSCIKKLFHRWMIDLL